MRKLFAVVALACAGLSLLAAGAFAKPAPSPIKLTINPYAEGVFGYLTGAKQSCLANRKVVVYEQLGTKREPATDRKVGGDKASLVEGRYRYAVDTDTSDNFYAVAAATKGCAAATSGSVKGISVAAAGGPNSAPVCSPYIFEVPSEVCSLQRPGQEWGISYDFPSIGTEACSIAKESYNCNGNAGGPFPFGANAAGSRGAVNMSWNPGPGYKAIVIVTGGSSGYGTTRMEGRLPNAGSAELSVDKWSVVRDTSATTEFFTPNLPGQKAGEPGGPLYLNFEGGKGAFGLGAEVHIKGYLYVKR